MISAGNIHTVFLLQHETESMQQKGTEKPVKCRKMDTLKLA